MVRGIKTSTKIVEDIINYRKQGKSVRLIANTLDIPKSTVYNNIKLNLASNIIKEYKQRGRKNVLGDRDIRRISREISMNEISINKLRNKLNISASNSTILRAIHEIDVYKYCRKKFTPNFKNKHSQSRLTWAKEKITWGDKWKSVKFSDEKRFNLDGPAGLAYY